MSIRDQYEQFEPKNRAAWRKWLLKQHAKSKGILLVYVKKPKRSLSYGDAVEEALCFGWIDSTLFPIDDARYMQLFTPRKPKSGWSAVNKRRIEAMVKAGLMAPAGHAKIEAAKKDGSWTRLDHIETLTIPPEFERALAKNAKARATFETLPPFARKTFLYWITGAKREETRAKRIAQSIKGLAARLKHPHMDQD
jgi:uncharacterized protein YdeI (YjbR/CyaY-like superfamily)